MSLISFKIEPLNNDRSTAFKHLEGIAVMDQVELSSVPAFNPKKFKDSKGRLTPELYKSACQAVLMPSEVKKSFEGRRFLSSVMSNLWAENPLVNLLHLDSSELLSDFANAFKVVEV